MKYPINEIYETIQGEGFYAGQPSIFIRIQGCPIHCSWCDTKYTWNLLKQNETDTENVINKKKSTKNWAFFNVFDIINIIQKRRWKSNHIVITGGEPCIFNLTFLTKKLEKMGYSCQIETSGTYTIYCSKKTWVTVSPKINFSNKIIKNSILRANEIKYPVLKNTDISELEILLKNSKNDLKSKLIFLQPVDQNKKATELCIKLCLIKNWRLSIQIQKYLMIP
ncbi:7-carboxy-7-deazaguanine synthase QueE [Buchnera aphidicola (Mindarus keteleerifoliae)]|uniref:7-carboxy-7-deazaguanine synthase QueE n=1 Tax=Buchnera aphidicola TaxID=9 RepID=UPI0031B73A20